MSDIKKLLAVIVVLVAVLAVVWGVMSGPVKRSVKLEAGEPLEISAFIKKNIEGSFVTDVSGIDTKIPSKHTIEIKVDGKTYTSELTVSDTTKPSGIPVKRFAVKGFPLEPGAFVEEIADVSPVSWSFRREVDFSAPGEVTVEIVLEDSSGNSSVVKATLCVLAVREFLEAEAGFQGAALSAQDFFEDPQAAEGSDAVLLTELSPLLATVGQHTVKIGINGHELETALRVVDTIPPVGYAVDVNSTIGLKLEAADFVRDISDVTDVAVNFAETPDLKKEGRQTVKIELVDEGGNRTGLSAALMLERDEVPPVIGGSLDKIVVIGEAIAYRKDVTVTDNIDETIELSVDSGAVDARTAGSYPVYYSAVDSSGNTAKAEGKLTVVNIDLDGVNSLADQILSQIIKDGMSSREKAKAVYDWVITRIRYVSTGEKTNVYLGAYNGFKLGQGDCYTFYAASEVLLARLGIENMPVERVPGKDRHYWNLVNLGDGWYHFDACPRKTPFDGFMFTDSQADGYTKLLASKSSTKTYYVYDKSLYPTVVQ